MVGLLAGETFLLSGDCLVDGMRGLLGGESFLLSGDCVAGRMRGLLGGDAFVFAGDGVLTAILWEEVNIVGTLDISDDSTFTVTFLFGTTLSVGSVL